MRIGSLFSGHGALDAAVEAVTGATTAWFSEFDKAPSAILAHHWPDVPNHGDITTIDWAQVEPVDIITGGFPCQDVSHAGKRAGLGSGTRTGLWSYMRDAIASLQPRLVVAENVRGLLSAKADSDVEPCPFCMGDDEASPMRALGAILADLADIGYDAAWCGLRAADVGAPHGRFRVFVTAWPAADAPGDGRHEGWAEPAGIVGRPDASLSGAPAPDAGGGGRERRTHLEGEGRHPAIRSQAGRDAGDSGPSPLTLLPTPVTNDMGAGKTVEDWDAWTDRMKTEHGNGNGHGKSLHIEAARTVEEQILSPHTAMGGIDWGDYAPAIARWEALTRPAPPPTEPTGKGGAHRLSPRFVEWLMGLPDGHVTGVDVSRNDQLKALGNGVVPQQAEAALRHLLSVRSQAVAA